MRIVLCDDDERILVQLEGYLREYFQQNGIGQPEYASYASGDALLAIEDRPDAPRADMVFLDVEMSLGQMLDDVNLAVAERKPVKFYGRCGGKIPGVSEVERAVQEAWKEVK